MNIGLWMLAGSILLGSVGLYIFVEKDNVIGFVFLCIAIFLFIFGAFAFASIRENEIALQTQQACLAMSGQWLENTCYLLLDGKIIQVIP